MSNIASNYWKFYNAEYPLNVMVIGKTICDSDYYVHRNNSRIMALEYIVKGSEFLKINGKEYNPAKNDAIILTKYSDHEYFLEKNELLEKEWIVFDGELAENLIKIYIPQNEYCFYNCNLSHYFEEINRIRKNYGDNYDKLTDNLSVVLHRMFIHIKNSLSESNYNLAQQIQRYLDANIETKIDMDALSREFNYSKNQIIRVFKQEYGITPYKYFVERKIDVAKLYLSNTSHSVNDISKLLAFSDQNYFSSEFKRITSMSPTEYRKQINMNE